MDKTTANNFKYIPIDDTRSVDYIRWLKLLNFKDLYVFYCLLFIYCEIRINRNLQLFAHS